MFPFILGLAQHVLCIRSLLSFYISRDAGATCTDAYISYTCTCAMGWTGDNCEVDVDECAVIGTDGLVGPSHCHSLQSSSGNRYGGICIESNDTHSQQTLPLPSSDIPLVAPGTFRCVCANGFTTSDLEHFTDCDVDINECASIPCENGGTCSESNTLKVAGSFAGTSAVNTGACRFPFTYNGMVHSSCAYDDNMNVPWCALASGVETSGVFIPGGVKGDAWQDCHYDSQYDLDLLSAYRCDCQAGFSGINCGADIDECASQPCGQFGICKQPLPDSYRCECIQGYSGEHCTIAPEPDYLWLIIVIVAGVIFLVTLCILCMIKRKADNLIRFTVSSLDKNTGGKKKGFGVEMEKTDFVEDLMDYLEKQESIPKLEQRLFLIGRQVGDTGVSEEDKMLNPGLNLIEAGIYDGCEVKLLQVWSLNVKDTIDGTDYPSNEFPVLCMVERHMSVRAVKFMVEDITGVKFDDQRLSAPDDTMLDSKTSLPVYESHGLINGSTLLLSYAREEFKEVPQSDLKPIIKRQVVTVEAAQDGEHEGNENSKRKGTARQLDPKAEREKMTANSVLSMAAMFQAQQVPGATLSELQQLAMRKR